MNSIALFIISTIFFLVFFLLVWKLFNKGSEDIKKEFHTAKNKDTIEILNTVKMKLLAQSDALKDERIEKAVEKTFLKANSGVRVGLLMGVDIIDEMIEDLKNPNKDLSLDFDEMTSATTNIDNFETNKNKRCYTFDTVAKSMFGENVFEEDKKNENV